VEVIAFPAPAGKAPFTDIDGTDGLKRESGAVSANAGNSIVGRDSTGTWLISRTNGAAEGTLRAVPAGNWVSLAIWLYATGKTIIPHPQEGEGLECDKLQKSRARDAHWDGGYA